MNSLFTVLDERTEPVFACLLCRRLVMFSAVFDVQKVIFVSNSHCLIDVVDSSINREISCMQNFTSKQSSYWPYARIGHMQLGQIENEAGTAYG